MRVVQFWGCLLLWSTVFFLSVSGVSAQSDGRVVMVVGGDTVRVGEFLYNYERNREFAAEAEPLTLERFKDMFLVYRLKVADAKSMGLDTLPQFRRDYMEYRDHQLAPYLVDSAERESVYRKAYARMGVEVEICHILFSSERQGGLDSAKNRALTALKRYRGGEDFLALARELSDDPSVGQNSGCLGYVGAFTTVAPFEEAVYSLADGEISEPVRTRFGYHLILRRASRKSRGRMLVAHIFRRIQGNTSSRGAAKQLLDSLYGCLQRGEDFGSLANRYSEDKSTAARGGVLPWVEAGYYPEQIIDEVFKLKADGDYTHPVFTPFGCHIFKRLVYEPLGTFEQTLPRVKESLARVGVELEGSEAVRRECVSRVGYRVDEGELQRLLALGNARGWRDTLDFEQKARAIRVAAVGGSSLQQGVPLTGSDLLNFMWRQNFLPDSMSMVQLQSVVSVVASDRCVEVECARLRASDAHLDNLLREYYDGTLLFEVSQRKHWLSPRLTTDFLQSHYRRNKRKYRFVERVSVDMYRVGDSATMRRYASTLCGPKGKKKVDDRACKRDGVTRSELNLERGNYLVNALMLDAKGRAVDAVSSATRRYSGEPVWRGGCLQKWSEGDSNGKHELYRYRGIRRNVQKSFEEAHSEVQYDCQGIIESDWVKELRDRIPVWVNEPLLKELEVETSATVR